MTKTKKQRSTLSRSQYLKDQIIHQLLLESIVSSQKTVKSDVKLQIFKNKRPKKVAPKNDKIVPETANNTVTEENAPSKKTSFEAEEDYIISTAKNQNLDDIKKMLGLTPQPTAPNKPQSLTIKYKKAFNYKRWALVLGVLMLVVVIFQVLYPKDRTLPFARLQSVGYQGFASKQEVLSSFDNFGERIVTVHTHTKTLTTSYNDLGVTISPHQTVDQMTDYSLKSRLVPFSFVFKGNKTYYLDRSIDSSRLDLYVKDVIALASKQPVDAVVSKNGTRLSTTESEDGYRYEVEALRNQILRSDLSNNGQIIFAPTVLRPKLSSQTAKEAINKMQRRIDTPLIISGDTKTYTVSSDVLASWVVIKLLPEQQNIELSFDKSAVASTLSIFISQINKNQIPSKTTLLNGVQAGRQEGSSGRKTDQDDLIKRVSESTNPSVTSVEVSIATIPAGEVTERRYSKDNQGVQSMLNYWTSTHKGEYSIDIRSIDDKISANYNGFRIMPASGFNKAYIASLIYGKVTSGYSSLQTLVGGQTIETCLNKMIQASDDNCTNLLGDVVGWSASDATLKAQGLASTTLSPNSSLTSASDGSIFLQKVYNGSVISRSYSSMLLTKMQNSANRTGIPAGSKNTSVASLSGSYGRVKNDFGLVYSPNTKYVISVMSDGANASDIADLATEAYKIFNQ